MADRWDLRKIEGQLYRMENRPWWHWERWQLRWWDLTAPVRRWWWLRRAR